MSYSAFYFIPKFDSNRNFFVLVTSLIKLRAFQTVHSLILYQNTLASLCATWKSVHTVSTTRIRAVRDSGAFFLSTVGYIPFKITNTYISKHMQQFAYKLFRNQKCGWINAIQTMNFYIWVFDKFSPSHPSPKKPTSTNVWKIHCQCLCIHPHVCKSASFKFKCLHSRGEGKAGNCTLIQHRRATIHKD